MKAKELRIGNYVKYLDSITLVESIGDQTIIIGSNHSQVDITSIKPIPITEEWLLKFGFKKELESFFLLFNNDFVDIEFSSDFKICFIGENEIYHIKYIHQLQNLYFALTGKELKWKK